MSGFYLPADGSVLVVDDKTEDALPLIELLSSKGLACTYYSGADEKLPAHPVQKVRLAFFDIQLFPISNPTSYTANILRLIDRLVPSGNGPYILVLWTTFASHEADTVERQLRAELPADKKPLDILRLEKSDYFETFSDSSMRDTLLSEINETLSSRFSPDDLHEIQRVVDSELLPENKLRARNDAIKKISIELNSKLKNAADSFQLFTHWESVINRAAGTTVEHFSSLHEIDGHWPDNLKNIIMRLARAQLGQTVSDAKEDEVLRNALRTMNGTLLDLVEYHYPDVTGFSKSIRFNRDNIQFLRTAGGTEYKIKWNRRTDKYKVYIGGTLVPARSHGVELKKVCNQGRNPAEKTHLRELVDAYESIKPSINTKLLIDTQPPSHVQPGNVYLREVHVNRRRTLLKNYYKVKPILDDKGKCALSNDELKKFKFIELEATPVCDYAQKKWIKYRLLPGLMVPESYAANINKGESFYHDIPIVKLYGVNYKIVFDFRLFKSIDKNDHIADPPIFRLRNELSASILSRLSSHASRIGITSLE